MYSSAISNIEDELSYFGDYYYIGGGRYECRDTGNIGTYDEIVPQNTVKRSSGPVKQEAKDARAKLRPFGFKALTGSKKQKDWAEKIRLEIMTPLPSETKMFFAAMEVLPIHRASFWIENRHKSSTNFAEFERGLINLCADLNRKVEEGMLQSEANSIYNNFVSEFASS
ncbi:hypothetical protein ACGYLI_16735 [Sulfitobacter sp. 1A13421]|uniref:hypothetical protein n=1 Tax=Sulfitobacter sp. 1A13421 TaxID=3368595 RepID=UPI003745C7C8